jgi:hypothetical protein
MKTLHLAALAIFAAVAVQAASITTITNTFPGYAFATNGWTASADGVFIPLAALPALTASNAVASGTGSDIRVLLYAINDQAYTVYTATVSTNRPSNTTISRNITVSGTSDYNASHALQTKWTFSATLTPQ